MLINCRGIFIFHFYTFCIFCQSRVFINNGHKCCQQSTRLFGSTCYSNATLKFTSLITSVSQSDTFLGAFAKLRQEIVMSVRSSIRPNGTTRLLLHKFSLTFKNLASYIQDVHTATLQMLHFIYFFSTNVSTEYFKHAARSPFFSSKCCLFRNATFFGSCVIYILHTGCAKISM